MVFIVRDDFISGIYGFVFNYIPVKIKQERRMNAIRSLAFYAVKEIFF